MMNRQKTKPSKIPKNQQELVRQYKAAFKKMRPKTLPMILKLREQFKAKGMAI